MDHWRSFRYKNLTLFVISVLFAVLLSSFEPFHAFLLNLGSLGYFGAFLAGILFVSTFTVATGVVIFLVLSKQLSPIEIGLVAGFGAVVGDFTIFRFIKDNLLEAITLLRCYIANISVGHCLSLEQLLLPLLFLMK